MRGHTPQSIQRFDSFKYSVLILLIVILIVLLLVRGCQSAPSPTAEEVTAIPTYTAAVQVVRPILYSPLTGTTVNAGEIEIMGEGSPGQQLEILLDGNVYDRVTVGPDRRWSYVLPITDAGDHEIGARTTGDSGQVVEADALRLTVLVPQVDIAAPSLDLTILDRELTNGQIALRGMGEPGTQLNVLSNGELLGETIIESDGTWNLSANIDEPGDYALSLQTMSASGQVVATATAVSVAILPLITPTSLPTNTPPPAVQPPAIDLSLLTEDLSTGEITLGGTGLPESALAVLVNGSTISTTTVAADGTWSVVTVFEQSGLYTLGAHTVDEAGNILAEATPVSIILSAPTSAALFETGTITPAALGSLTIDSFVVEALTDGSLLSLSGTGETDSEVQILVNESLLTTTTVDLDGAWSAVSALDAPDNYQVLVRAIAPAGDVVTATIPMGALVVSLPTPTATTKATPEPTATVTNTPLPPAPSVDDFAIRRGFITTTLIVTGTGEPLSSLQILIDSTVIGTDTVDAAGTWSHITTLGRPGEYVVTAQSLDEDGAILATSLPLNLVVVEPSVSLTVTATPVPLTIDDGTRMQEFSRGLNSLRGTGSPGSNIEIVVNGIAVDEVTVGPDGAWQYELALERPDTYDVSVRILDARGATVATAEPISVTVREADTPTPAPTVVDTPAPTNTPELAPTATDTPYPITCAIENPRVLVGEAAHITGVGQPNSTINIIVGGTVGRTVDADNTGQFAADIVFVGAGAQVINCQQGDNPAATTLPILLVVNDPATATATNTATSVPTETPELTDTVTPVPTDTSEPTATETTLPTDTPEPTATETTVPTDTPEPTATETTLPTDTQVPAEPATATPVPTDTSLPTDTATPIPTNTVPPEPTATVTDTPEPTIVATTRFIRRPTQTPTEVPEAVAPSPTEEAGVPIEEAGVAAAFARQATRTATATVGPTITNTPAPTPPSIDALPVAVYTLGDVVTFSGTGQPGTELRVLFDEAFVDTVTVGPDGVWEWDVELSIPGVHTVQVADTNELFLLTSTVVRAAVVTPTATVTDTPMPTDTPVPTNTPEPTDTATATDTAVPTSTETATSEPTTTPIPTDTPVPTDTVTATSTSTATETATATTTPRPVSTARFERRPTQTPTEIAPPQEATPTSEAVALAPTATATATNIAPSLNTEPFRQELLAGVPVIFTGSGQPGAMLQVLVNGAVADETMVDASGTWTWSTTFEAAEAYTIQVVDNNGLFLLTSAQLRAVVVAPTPTPTNTSTATDTPSPTDTATPIPTDTATPTDPATPIPTNTPKPTATATDTATPVPTATPTPTRVPPVLDAAPFQRELTVGSATFTGQGNPGTELQMLINGTPVDTVTVGQDGRWEWTTSFVEAGGYAIQAVDSEGDVLLATAQLMAIVAEPTATPTPTRQPTSTATNTRAPTNTATATYTPVPSTPVPTTRFERRPTQTATATSEALLATATPIIVAQATVPTATPTRLGPTLDPALFATARQTGAIRFTGTGQPGVELQILVDGARSGVVVVASDGTWTWTAEFDIPGEYSVQVVDSNGIFLLTSAQERLTVVAPTPTATATNTATATPTATPTDTATPIPTATSTDTATPVPTSTSTHTPAPTSTSTDTATPVPTSTSTYTPAPTSTSTDTATPTSTPVPVVCTVEKAQVLVGEAMPIVGSAQPDSTIEIVVGGAVVDTVSAAANGSFTAAIVFDGAGTQFVSCRQADNIAAATLPVLVSIIATTPTNTVTATATATATETATSTATPTPRPTNTVTATPTPVPTATHTATPQPTATPVPTPSPTASPTATPLPTATATATPTPLPTATSAPTDTPEPTATDTATAVPTHTPVPTHTATPEPTETPVPTDTDVPTDTPEPTVTNTATVAPTATSTSTPEPTATSAPTDTPEPTATDTATSEPTATPVPTNTDVPTNTPMPTATVTKTPIIVPTSTDTPEVVALAPTATVQVEEPATLPSTGLSIAGRTQRNVLLSLLILAIVGGIAWAERLRTRLR